MNATGLVVVVNTLISAGVVFVRVAVAGEKKKSAWPSVAFDLKLTYICTSLTEAKTAPVRKMTRDRASNFLDLNSFLKTLFLLSPSKTREVLLSMPGSTV